MSSGPESGAQQAAAVVQSITCPWSKNRLRKLGKAIRDSRETPEDIHTYQEVMAWYNELAVATQGATKLYLATQSDFAGLEPTSRTKTKATLRDKLNRDHNFNLPALQDIAGIRIEGPFTLSQQDQLALGLATFFGQPSEIINDLRDSPRSGYRAVHLQLEFAGRVEIQIRTKLQSQWANAYEKLGDILGRGIRYGNLPENPRDREYVLDLQEESAKFIAMAEKGVEVVAASKLSEEYGKGILEGLRDHAMERKPEYRKIINDSKLEIRKLESRLKRTTRQHEKALRELDEHFSRLNLTFQTFIDRSKEDSL